MSAKGRRRWSCPTGGPVFRLAAGESSVILNRAHTAMLCVFGTIYL